MSSGQDLRRATILGVRWFSLSRITAEITALCATVVLARLIPPAEFGRAAVAMIVVAVAVILGPLGLTSVLVQRPSLMRRQIEGAAFLSLFFGVVLTAATLLFSRTAAGPLFGDRTASLLALVSGAWLLTAVGGVPHALVQRELRFRRLAVMESGPIFLAALTSVSLAIAGLDGEALIAGGLILRGSTALIALGSVGWVAPKPSRAGISDIAGFATPATLSSLVYLGFRNVDYAILGARMAPDQVGYYWRAYQFGVQYQGKISQIMQRVSFPIYSRAESLAEIRHLRLRIVRTHATVILPLLATFVVVAPELIPWLLGATWEPAVLPAQIMAAAGMAEAMTTGVGSLMTALGRPKRLLVWNLCSLVVYALMIALLAPFGLNWIAAGVAVFGAASVVVLQKLVVGPVLQLGIGDLWRDVFPGLAVAACVLAGLSAARELLLETGLPTFFLLCALGALAMLLYAVALRVLFADVWADLMSITRRVGGRSATPSDDAEASAPTV